MRILLTGATGYIGKRLLRLLLDDGHNVICVVRDKKRFPYDIFSGPGLEVVEADFLDKASLKAIPDTIDAAYYLIHSMSASIKDFEKLERTSAENFRDRIEKTHARQLIYLSGIVNDNKLSAHLKSRKRVEDILASGTYALTTLRAGIIVGSGSASFEIIRDLVEKLPMMITPRWLNTRSQPIAITDVLQYLKGVLLFEKTYNKSFDIGGPQILTYKEMLLGLAKVRGLRRIIITLPVMTPRLSSYWLYFVTSTSYKLAINLVDSMKIEIICQENPLSEWLNINPLTYEEAVRKAFGKIEQQEVLSSWTDALSGNKLEKGLNALMQIPSYGCLKDSRSISLTDEEKCLKNIFAIGGKNGWYANWLWEIRGLLDKAFGGVGLRRGRKNQSHISSGESLDFWRVIYASRENKRLLLYAEMKLPGEAWLELKIKDQKLYQTASFRPKGIWGRLYWFALLPMHFIIFKGMLKRLAK